MQPYMSLTVHFINNDWTLRERLPSKRHTFQRTTQEVWISFSPLKLFSSCSLLPSSVMSVKSAINKEVFIPHDEKMLVAAQVKRRTKKKIPFLATGGQGDYMTFICIS
ncbi:hypothetical protein JOQ06_028830, partial [Pogonophryne albipinna]